MTIDIHDLDPSQRAVVEAKQQSRLIVGGAASGKSTALGHCMAKALEDAQESTTQMLALAPTSQGKTELQAVLDMYLPNARDHVQVMTIEDWCITLLREYGHAIGVQPDIRRLDVHDDREKCREALLAALNTVGVSAKWVTRIGLEAAREVLLYGPTAFFRGSERDRWVQHFLGQRRPLAKAYTAQLRARNHVDEVGLAWSVLTLLTEAPVVARALGSRYTHAFVDDLHQGSSDEALVLEALGRHIAHITVAVDDDASPRIWDPVDAATLRWLAETLPMHVHYLERNYRSPEPVVHLANALRRHRWEGLPDKPPMVAVRRGTPGSSLRVRSFPTGDDEVRWVIADIAERPATERARCVIVYPSGELWEVMDGRLKDAGLIGTRSEPRDVVRLVGPDEMQGTTAAHVYVVELVDSIWPQPPRVDLFDTRGLIDVDRRLFLGAIVGAGESLTLTFARDYWGTIVVPSRFLHEVEVLSVEITDPYVHDGQSGAE